MRKFYIIVLITFIFSGLQAQNSDWIFATVSIENAQLLKQNHPEEIEILNSSSTVSAVKMSQSAAVILKDYGNLHGPGYIFRPNESAALSALQYIPNEMPHVLDFTITEDTFVNQCLDLVNPENIGQNILDLESYGTRFHTKPSGVQASLDIGSYFMTLVQLYNRNDILVEYFDHSFTNQKSVIVTFPGSELPNEIVVLGGHLDSGDYSIQNFAPGADDNASGIATMSEVVRVLLENDFQPKRTVQIMAYAAEEVGLWGSSNIAQTYKAQNKNVLAVMQLDMTNYNGSNYDVAIISDPAYTSNELNLFLIELMEHYNSGDEHPITYGISYCNYACSDHVSWTENGYPASFPIEAAMNDTNPYIHTPNDTYASMGNTAVHSAKFAKLALQFAIEIAKTQEMSTQEVEESSLSVVIQNKNLIYKLNSDYQKIHSIQIFDTSARSLVQLQNRENEGLISLQNLPSGFYIAVFKDEKGKAYSKKFLLK